jgi:hypothetical protein
VAQRFQRCETNPYSGSGLNSLLKSSRFVSGYAFRHIANDAFSVAPSGAAPAHPSFSAKPF